MANPTTYFGWVMPNSADLVTDLPADFNVFGQGVDTSMQFLLGGTTGQVLSKTSATNMAFTWINNDQGDITGVTAGTGITVTSPTGPVPTVAIDTAVTADLTTAQTLTNKTLTSPALTTPTISTLTTNGDLLYGTGSGALARRAIGSTSQVLTVAGGIPTWATPTSGSMTLLSTTSLSGASVTISSISGSYTHLWINISGLTSNTGQSNAISLELNGAGADGVVTTQISNNVVGSNSANASWQIGEQASGATSYFNGFLYDYSSAKLTSLEGMWGGKDQFTYNRFSSGFFNRDAAITSIKILANNTTMTAGSLKIYGVN